MAEFKVGGYVVCIETCSGVSTLGEKFGYTKDSIYQVKEIKTCSCGDISLWLGDVMVQGYTNNCFCCCGKLLGHDRVYAKSRRFLPLDDFKEVTFTKINEEVPVSAQ